MLLAFIVDSQKYNYFIGFLSNGKKISFTKKMYS